MDGQNASLLRSPASVCLHCFFFWEAKRKVGQFDWAVRLRSPAKSGISVKGLNSETQPLNQLKAKTKTNVNSTPNQLKQQKITKATADLKNK